MLTSSLTKTMSYEEEHRIPPKKLTMSWHTIGGFDNITYQGYASDENDTIDSAITIRIGKPTIIDYCRGINPKQAEIIHLVSNQKYGPQTVHGALEKLETMEHIEHVFADYGDDQALKKFYVQLGFHEEHEPVKEMPSVVSRLFAQLSSMVYKKLGWEETAPKRLVYDLDRHRHHEKED